MPNVKWHAIPPVRGPNPQGVNYGNNKKNVRTFASYEVNDELFSDRNVFPKGCVLKMERINEK